MTRWKTLSAFLIEAHPSLSSLREKQGLLSGKAQNCEYRNHKSRSLNEGFAGEIVLLPPLVPAPHILSNKGIVPC